MKVLQILCFFAFCGRSVSQEQTYLITGPKVFRVGASESIVAQAFGYSEDLTVHIAVKSHPDKRKTYSSGRVTLSNANRFQGSVTLTILPKDLPRKDGSRKYVYLEAVSASFTKEEQVPVSYQNGFLFIQTDKPIYTPDQSVKARVYSLNEELKPAGRTIIVTFADPEGVKMDVMEADDFTGIVSLPYFQIPSNPRYGVWQIQASYKNDFTTSATAEFEIKEYAMPSFATSIEPENNFICYETFENFKITITARYFHGRMVSRADVFVRFGIIDANNEKIMMPKSIQSSQMLDGVAEVFLNSKTAAEEIGRGSLEDLDESHLYISVAVIEQPGGHTEESEHAAVKYVLSPYTLNLVGTPLFVKPRLPFFIKAQVKDTNKQPVGDIPLVLTATSFDENNLENLLITEDQTEAKKTTKSLDGTALFVVNIPADTKRLEFKIQTAVAILPEENQASKEYVAKSYSSLSRSYLYIDWAAQHKTLNVGEYLNLNLYPSSHYLFKIKHFSYLVVSKGKIVSFDSVPRFDESVYQSINIRITRDMIPSARILAYYIVTGEGSAELVADSVWLNVEEKCVNNQKLELLKDASTYQPGQTMYLSIQAQHSSFVGLSVTDIAIHEIRTRSKKSMERVLQYIEKSDLGCGGGGGHNNVQVFDLAGLTFMTNANAKAAETMDKPCTEILRPKRAIDFTDAVKSKVETFKDPGVRKCCDDGIKEYPITQTCFERASRITKGTMCYKAFVHCCQFANKLRAEDPSNRHLILARMQIQAIFGLDEPQIRSFFPESWLWEVHEITERAGLKKLSVTLPDSLTTWEIQGVGISDNGICVADSLKVQVFKEIFLKMKMPYSVVRGEQIELQGSIYNYKPDEAGACVTMTVAQGVCLFKGSMTSTQGTQGSSCNKIKIPGLSAWGISFTILPLELGLHTVNFTLKSTYGNEIVVHTLRVVPEGVKREKHVGFTMDPQGVYGMFKRRQEVRYLAPLNLVPKTNIERTVSVKAEILGEVISTVLSPEGVNTLTSLPRGSGEAELMRIAPVFYIFHYLETTDNWELLGPNSLTARVDMRRKMKDGIVSILSFRSKDYSYSVWKDGEPSTWLTAFALRILGQVDKYVPQDKNAMCNSMLWLTDRCQYSDGSFWDRSSYQAVKLQGTSQKETKERDLYLTAFTVIGLRRAFSICPTQGIKDALYKAEDYLFKNRVNAQSTFVLAIISYALALSDTRSTSANLVFSALKKEALIKGEPPLYRFWKETFTQQDSSTPSEVTARMVETTAYALLTALLTGDKDYTNPIIRWLSEQQRYGGGFFSTQDTVTALEGLTNYALLLKRITPDMIIKVSYKKYGELKRYEFSEANAFGRPFEVPLKDDLIVTTGSGSGIATVNVRTVYHTISNSDENCDFKLKINVLSEPNTDKARRKRRQSPEGISAEEARMRLQACAKYTPRPNEPFSASSHAVMDIALVSGLEAEEDDLAALTNGVDQLIADYQIVDNHVILQFDSIPSDNPICVVFRVKKIFKVGMSSPAVFTVYEYHTPDKRCSEFYNPYGEETLVKLCNKEECKCMEGECSKMKRELDLSISVEDRQQVACKKDILYAYKVNIGSSHEEGNFVKYQATVQDVFKKGEDFVKQGTNVAFIKKTTCTEVVLNEGESYLIMGKEGTRTVADRSFQYEYPLDSTNWIEWWPLQKKCSTVTCSNFIKTLEDFSENFLIFGCN